MTSNIASQEILDSGGELGKDELDRHLAANFRPEFLNRIDEIVVFKPLTLEHMGFIVELQLGQLKERLEDKGIKVRFSDEVKELLIREGFDQRFGARPLKRTIERLVANPLARILINGQGRRSYRVMLAGGKLVFDSEEA
ncbi:Chaperone protein ClpB [subsurface metagenome]|nr:hypothetical protein [bacterium]